MFLLVFSILFIAVDAQAYMHGNNYAEDFVMASGDRIYAYANVSVDGPLTDDNQVNITFDLLGLGPRQSEMDCQHYAEYSICTFDSKRVTADTESKQEPYGINVYGETDNIIESYTGNLVFDSVKPKIDALEIESGAVYTTFSIDYDDSDDFVACSNLKKIEIYKDSSKKDTIDVSNQVQGCLGNVEASVYTKNLGEGNSNITVKVYDAAGNSYSKSQMVEIASVASFSVGNKFSLLSMGDESIEYCINDYGSAKLVFGVTTETEADSINLVSESLGLSTSVNPNSDCKIVSSTDSELTYVCTKSINYDCEPIEGKSSVTKEILVSLCNFYGDCSEPQTLSAKLKIDTKKPSVSSAVNVYGPYNEEQSYKKLDALYMGEDARLKFYIQEQSGVDITNSYLDVEGTKIKFDSCELNGKYYECIMNDLDIDEENGTATLYVKDVSSNEYSKEYDFVVDNELPVILEAGLKSTEDDLNFFNQQYIIDVSHIKLLVTIEDLPAKIYVMPDEESSTNIIDSIYNISCSEYENEFGYVANTCDVDEIHVLTEEVDNGELNFVVVKPSGKYVERTINVSVIEHEDQESNIYDFKQAKLIKGSMTRQSAIKKQNLLFTSDYTFINSESEADIADVVIDYDSCSGSNLLSYPRVDFVTSNKIYFSIDMDSASERQLAEFDQLNMTCNASIFAVQDGKKLAQEVETIDFIIPLSNDPQSNLGSALQAKIDEAMSDSKLKLASKLGWLTDLVTQFRNACSLINGFSRISEVYNTVTNIVDKRCDYEKKKCDANANANPDPITKANLLANCLSRYTACKADAKAKDRHGTKLDEALGLNSERLGKFCDFVGCKTSSGLLSNQPQMNVGGYQIKAFNPSASLYTSMASLCLPGIVDHLQNYKLIQCSYIDCLKNQVPHGVPIAVCEQQYKYQMCVYEKGQMFALIPFKTIFDTIGGQIKGILENPLSMILKEKWRVCSFNNDVQQNTECKILKALAVWQEFEKIRDSYEAQSQKRARVNEVCGRAGVD